MANDRATSNELNRSDWAQAAENGLGNNPTSLRWIDVTRDRGVVLK